MPVTSEQLEKQKQGSPALQQGFKVLNALIEAGRAQGVSQLALSTGLSKASVYRLLKSFQAMGYVTQHVSSKQYALTPQLFSFIWHLTSHFQPSRRASILLREAARATGFSVYLSMLMDTCSCVVAASGPQGDTAVLGVSGPACVTASGKALVAQLEPESWVDYFDSVHAKRLGLSLEQFLAQLEQSKHDGIFLSVRENFENCAIAIPVAEPGRTARFALAFFLPHEQWCVQDIGQMKVMLRTFADKMSLEISPRVVTAEQFPMPFHP